MIAEGRGPFRLLNVKPTQPKKVAAAESFYEGQTNFGTRQLMECSADVSRVSGPRIHVMNHGAPLARSSRVV